MLLSLFVLPFPIYQSGIIVIMLFSFYLGWFPIGRDEDNRPYFIFLAGKIFGCYPSPRTALAVAFLYYIGDVVVIARTSILELIGEEFLEYAKARGLSPSKVRKIAMRNAIIPVVTYSTIMVGFAFGGQVSDRSGFFMAGSRKIDGGFRGKTRLSCSSSSFYHGPRGDCCKFDR